MFETVYKIALQATSFKDLQAKLKGHFIDTRQKTLPSLKKTLPFLTVAGQLAQEAQNEKVEWLRRLGASVDIIALGYALAGNHQKVEEYRTTFNANVNSIAKGYAYAGNDQKVEEYRTRLNADVNAIANSYALAGNYQQVEVFRTKYDADINTIIEGFKYMGNHKQVRAYSIDTLLNDYLEERTNQRDASGKTKEYFYGGFFSAFQKSFKQKDNAVRALQSALKGKPIDLSDHLSTLRNGNLGKELRAFIKSGKANRLVDKEVNTVSAFVEALQIKNIAKAQEGNPSLTSVGLGV